MSASIRRSGRKTDTNETSLFKPSTLSPFRYAGGKSWLREHILSWTLSLSPSPTLFFEPFAGGASVALAVAESGRMSATVIVERDPEVASVWQVALGDDCELLVERILEFRPNRQSVRRVLAGNTSDQVSVAFRCLVKNRVTRAGILAPGAGLLRSGEAERGIGSRWYPKTLAGRLRSISRIRDRIQFVEGDAMSMLPDYLRRKRTVCFIDPPYSLGMSAPAKRLYRFSEIDHGQLFRLVQGAMCPCALSYHDCAEVRCLARRHGFRISEVQMRNSHHSRRNELLLFNSVAIIRQTNPRKAFG